MSEPLLSYAEETSTCTRCPLAATRTQVVFGSGDPHAELMFVGEAPGFHEDKQGVPFVGQAGKLLETLLNGIGLSRADVYIANVLKCRPPGNRDPQPEEIEACESHLFHQIELIRPTLVATLGNFATKLLSGKPTGITRVHGVPQQVTLGGNEVTLYPLYHPAAALYTRSMLSVLEEDFRRIPELLGLTTVVPEPAELELEPELEPEASARSSRPSSSASSKRRGDALELPRGDGGDRRAAGARARAGRSRHDLGRARLRQDHLRTRRLPRPRRDGAGDEPDLHDRPSLRGRAGRLPPRPLPLHRRLRRRSGATSSRTSRTRSSSSSGRRRPEPGCRRCARPCGSSTSTNRAGES